MTALKRIPILLLGTLIFGFMCHKAPPEKPSEPPPETGTVTMLQSVDEQLKAMGVPANQVTKVDVFFGGPILHVTEGPSRRAVLPRDRQGHHPHTGLLFVNGANQLQFKAVFPKAMCEMGVCAAEIDGVGLKVVPAGPSLYAFDKSHQSFAKPVQHLKRLLPELDPEVYAEHPKLDGPVRAYFELAHGGFTAISYTDCPAKFADEDDSEFRAFGGTSTLHMIFRGGSILQVLRPDDKDWQEISLTENQVQIAIANYSAVEASHHDIFGELAKGGYVDLPDVIHRGGCKFILGGVPGCGNDQWP